MPLTLEQLQSQMGTTQLVPSGIPGARTGMTLETLQEWAGTPGPQQFSKYLDEAEKELERGNRKIGILDKLAEPPKAVGRALGGLAGDAMGGAPILPGAELFYKPSFGNQEARLAEDVEPTPELERRLDELNAHLKEIRDDVEMDPDIKDLWIYKAGQDVREWAEETFAADPVLKDDFILNRLPEVTTEFGFYTLEHAVAGPAAVVATIASSMGGGKYREYRESGVSEADARKAARWSQIVGAAVAPVFGRVLSRFDKAAGGQLSKVVGKWAAELATGAAEAGLMGLALQIANNGIDRLILKKEGSLLENALQAGGEMSAGGAVVNAIAMALGKGRGMIRPKSTPKAKHPNPFVPGEAKPVEQAPGETQLATLPPFAKPAGPDTQTVGTPQDTATSVPAGRRYRGGPTTTSELNRAGTNVTEIQFGKPETMTALERQSTSVPFSGEHAQLLVATDRAFAERIRDLPANRKAFEKEFPGMDSSRSQREQFKVFLRDALDNPRPLPGEPTAEAQQAVQVAVQHKSASATFEMVRAVEPLNSPAETMRATKTGAEIDARRVDEAVNEQLKQEAPGVPLTGKSDLSLPAYAEVGIDIAEVTDMARRGKSWFRSFMKRYFTSAGDLPDNAFIAKLARDGRLAELSMKIKFNTRRFNAAVKETYGSYENISDADFKAINAALHGELPIMSLPEGMRASLSELRNSVDGFSRMLIESGAAQGGSVARIIRSAGDHEIFRAPDWYDRVPEETRSEAVAWMKGRMRKEGIKKPSDAEAEERVRSIDLIETGAADGDLVPIILKNMGVYIARNYRATTDPKWADKVFRKHPNLVEEARRFIREQEAYENATEAEIDGLLKNILVVGKAADRPIAFISESKLGSKDVDLFMQRKLEGAPEIRALLGEIEDPRLNYVMTAEKMASVVANHEFLTRIRAEGMGKWLFPTKTGDFFYPIAAESSKPLYPLNGLYTTMEIAKAFERATADYTAKTKLGKLYLTVNAWTKYNKTVANFPMTHSRNFEANFGFAFVNAHWDVRKLKQALRAVVEPIGGSDRNWQEYYAKLAKLGVVRQGAHSNEIRAMFKDAFATEDLPSFIDRQTKSKVAKTLKKVGLQAKKELTGAGVLTEMYRAEDDFFKIFAFENEVARYRKAKPDWSQSKLEEHAAYLVRNTYPSYNMVPEGIQAIRRFPFVGPFPSFVAEVGRTMWKTLNITAAEMKDPDLRSIGARRIAGMTVMAGAAYGLAALSRYIYGVSSEQEKAIREFVPPWSRNSDYWHLGKNEKGQYTYIDMSYTDPYSYARNPINAFLNGEDWEKAIIQGLSEAASPFLDEDILASRLLDLSRNTKAGGGRIYNPQDTFDRKADLITDYLWQGIEPGTLTGARRLRKGISGEVGRHGTAFNWKQELLSRTTGVRFEPLDLPQAFSFKVGDFTREVRNANALVNEILSRRGTVSDEELIDAYARTEHARRELYSAMTRQYRAAKALGLDDSELVAIMDNRGMTKNDIASVILEMYVPYRQSDAFVKSLAETAQLFPYPGATTPEEYGRRMNLLLGETVKAMEKADSGR